jgi:uncharacterized membrane protein
MIECHVYNSFTRMDLREDGAYVMSQFVGGMASVLFLFMAGMTLGFQMDSLDRREPVPWRRWWGALRRGGYVLAIAFAFRLTNFVAAWPHAQLSELGKVDILNSMGVAMIALAALALAEGARRARWAVLAGVALAAVAPLVKYLPWAGVPRLLAEYVAPGIGRFPFFPWGAYVAFGVAVGTLVKRATAGQMERLMQWLALVAFALVFGAWHFSNIPFSIYGPVDFWLESPSLVLIRVGLSCVALVAGYVWTEFCVGTGWSWMQALGKTSLLVYWIHVMMVYGDIAKPLKRALSIPQATLATFLVSALMVALAAARLWWTARRQWQRERPAA